MLFRSALSLPSLIGRDAPNLPAKSAANSAAKSAAIGRPAMPELNAPNPLTGIQFDITSPATTLGLEAKQDVMPGKNAPDSMLEFKLPDISFKPTEKLLDKANKTAEPSTSKAASLGDGLSLPSLNTLNTSNTSSSSLGNFMSSPAALSPTVASPAMPSASVSNLSGSTTNTTQSQETKLSLAKAYLDIGDKEGAKELLQEVIASGHQSLSEQAKQLLAKV